MASARRRIRRTGGDRTGPASSRAWRRCTCVSARGTSGAASSASHVRAAVGDARGAVGVPRLHLDRLPDVERGLRRRRRAREAPAVRGDRQRDAQDAGDRELHRQRGAQPGGDAAQRDGDADREQVERAGEELGADQHGRRDPPDPYAAHRSPSLVGTRSTVASIKPLSAIADGAATPSVAGARRAAVAGSAPARRADSGIIFLFESSAFARIDRRTAGGCHADLRIPLLVLRPRARGAAEVLRRAARHLPVVRQATRWSSSCPPPASS